ncbi:MAG: sigma-54-dependent transcriptional regulator [Eubacteriales bacterium]
MGNLKRILIVDDEKEICTFFSYLLKNKGYDITTIQSGREAQETIDREKFHLALLDLKLPDIDGLTLLKQIKRKTCRCQVIIMTGYSTIKSAIAAMQMGSLDYIEKPFDDLQELERLIDSALNTVSYDQDINLQEMAEESGLVLGKNEQMIQVVDLARRIAAKNVTVLVQGETGTGKEVIARFMHNFSKRAKKPFIPINCAAISETLLESELFGYEKGAFTGANKTKKGYFEIATNGTLFLDEISEASLSTQAKLLRVLESGEFMRVGGETILKTDSRIIAATNVILDEAVDNRIFRQDLFYRLDVLAVKIPPLRERKEDIPYFLDYFLKRFAEGKDVEAREFAKETMEILCEYDWPGNVRELANLIQRLVAVVDEPVIKLRHLPEKLLARLKTKPVGNGGDRVGEAKEEVFNALGKDADLLVERLEHQLRENKTLDLARVLDNLTNLKNSVAKSLVKKALAETLGDRKAAADLLGISPRTLKYIYLGK